MLGDGFRLAFAAALAPVVLPSRPMKENPRLFIRQFYCQCSCFVSDDDDATVPWMVVDNSRQLWSIERTD